PKTRAWGKRGPLSWRSRRQNPVRRAAPAAPAVNRRWRAGARSARRADMGGFLEVRRGGLYPSYRRNLPFRCSYLNSVSMGVYAPDGKGWCREERLWPGDQVRLGLRTAPEYLRLDVAPALAPGWRGTDEAAVTRLARKIREAG